MILVGSQRGGGRQLAAHLMNDRDNDHVALEELRGFVADDLRGALDETRAVSKGTRCRQYVFSLSINPPKNVNAGLEVMLDAADRAEQALGLKDQPRGIIVHEKEGRRHIHAFWSRIDADEMKAINLPYFKTRLRELSRELFLEHGWELPEGHRTNGWKNPLNFTLAEWQQAKRVDLDPREIKQVFRAAWEASDNLASFKNALHDHGYYLAQGDRRGFVALDVHGEVYAVARWAGLKTKEVQAKLGSHEALPGVDAVRDQMRKELSARLREHIQADRKQKEAELEPLRRAQRAMIAAQRSERMRLEKGLREREQREVKQRAARFKRGLGAVMDFLTGKARELRRANEREAFDAYRRDRAAREALFVDQMKDRQALQQRIDAGRKEHRQSRMQLVRQVAQVLRVGARDGRGDPGRTAGRGSERQRQRERTRGGPKP
jgi:hypothetical protein